MATQVQLRRGGSSHVAAYTGDNGEIIIDTTRNTIFVQNGVVAGGLLLLNERTANGASQTVFGLINAAVQNVAGDITFSTNNLIITGNVTVTGHISGHGRGYANSIVISAAGGSSSTWTIPTNVTNVKCTVIGAGGGGGGTAVATAGYTGGGGGSGAVAIGYITVVPGVTTVSYNVGTEGAASSTTGAGGIGGESNVTYDGVVIASASGGFGGAPAPTVGQANGGLTVTGYQTYTGANGGGGGITSAGNPIFGPGGDTPLFFGKGGDKLSQVATGLNGRSGTGYGSGGSGGINGSGTTLRTGAAGAPGAVIFEW